MAPPAWSHVETSRGGVRPPSARTRRDHRRSRGAAPPETIASVPLARARRVADCGCDVLVTGATGSGKGRLAAWLHEHSRRSGRPFVPVNCGALPESLLDSHLFGHVKGAFSDAHRDHAGLVRSAAGGTLFLDEVGELAPEAQVRLLRLLEEREVQPVGALAPVPVDVRIVAATGRELADLVAEGSFRADLYFRLDVIRLRVAPLRERGAAAIDALATELAAEIAADMGRAPLVLDRTARAALRAHDWPGNVRELRSVLERIAILHDDAPVTARAVRDLGRLAPPPPGPRRRPGGATLDERIGGIRPGAGLGPHGRRADNARTLLASARRTANAEDATVRHETARAALEQAGGNVTAAARALGVHRSTVHRWLAAG